MTLKPEHEAEALEALRAALARRGRTWIVVPQPHDIADYVGLFRRLRAGQPIAQSFVKHDASIFYMEDRILTITASTGSAWAALANRTGKAWLLRRGEYGEPVKDAWEKWAKLVRDFAELDRLEPFEKRRMRGEAV